MISKNILLLSISLVIFVTTGSACAKLTDQQGYSLFSQANNAFRKANSATDETQQRKLYEKAILSYEKIINDGQISNAGLYYNLGNAYFLRRDIGRAILNYRRAGKLDSADANIKKNLAFARSKRVDKVAIKTEKRVLQTLFFWHYDFPTKTRFLLTCIFFGIVCMAVTCAIWFGQSAPWMVTTIICCILTITLFVSLVVEYQTETGRICGVITAKDVTARQGDGQNYPASFKDPLHEGTEFDLLEHRLGWFHIKLADDSDGWIPKTSADLI